MVEVKQGLNLESDISIIKIDLEPDNQKAVEEIMEKIGLFHQIFFYSYDSFPTQLTIRSKLPFLWRESAETLYKLSKTEITAEEATSHLVDNLIKRRIKSMSTISLLHSCMKKNIEITPTLLEKPILHDPERRFGMEFNRYLTLGCGKGSNITCSARSGNDSYIAQKIQKDKWATNTLIERLQLPVPKWEIISSDKDVERIWNSYEKPVVIKPTGLTAGHGVTVGIDTLQKAKDAFQYAKEMIDRKNFRKWQSKILIQEQVQGDDYRLLVINGKLQVVTKRIPAFIVGDGKKSIEKLIKKENRNPARDLSNPAHTLKPINIDKPLLKYLKEQELSLEYVPEKDEKIFVRKVASMSQGGITEDFTDEVSKEIRTIVESISQSLHIFTLGIDVMCKDISKPLTKDNGGILEVNMMPETYLNLYPVLGKQRDYVADIYVDELISEESCKKYVLVGQTKDDLPTLLRKKGIIEKDQTIGEIVGSKYRINGMEVDSEAERWQHVEAIKCNASLDVILLHSRDWDEVKEYGFGFDHINTLYITKENTKEKEYMRIVKKYKRKGLIDKIKAI